MNTVSRPCWQPLPRAEVIKAVERQGPSRVPLVSGVVGGTDPGADDVAVLWADPLDATQMRAPWKATAGAPSPVMTDWRFLEEFLACLPDPANDPAIERAAKRAEELRREDRYVLLGWWRLFLSRALELRTHTVLLADLHDHPDRVTKLLRGLADHFKVWLKRAIREVKPDGLWTSDDLCHQSQALISPKTFRSLFKPVYQQIGAFLRANEVHWWFHASGNLTHLVGDLADVGVQVIHPVSRGCMDELWISREYGDRLSFCAGLDVEKILLNGTSDDVRDEVRWLIDTFDRPRGGMCIGFDTALPANVSAGNLAAFLDEALRYGLEHRGR